MFYTSEGTARNTFISCMSHRERCMLGVQERFLGHPRDSIEGGMDEGGYMWQAWEPQSSQHWKAYCGLGRDMKQEGGSFCAFLLTKHCFETWTCRCVQSCNTLHNLLLLEYHDKCHISTGNCHSTPNDKDFTNICLHNKPTKIWLARSLSELPVRVNCGFTLCPMLHSLLFSMSYDCNIHTNLA